MLDLLIAATFLMIVFAPVILAMDVIENKRP
jgi:hypothetical protein